MLLFQQNMVSADILFSSSDYHFGKVACFVLGKMEKLKPEKCPPWNGTDQRTLKLFMVIWREIRQ